MAPPHTRFKPSFHNRLSHLSRHLFNRAESQHSSIKTVVPVHEDDDPNSLDRPQNISVDGFNQGLNPPEEPEIDPTSCDNHLSDEHACSTLSFETGNFAVGSPRHVKEALVARQSVIHSTSTVTHATIVSPTNNAAVTEPPTSATPTSTSSTHTSSPPETSTTNNSSQLPTTTTHQSSSQQSPATSSSHTVYPTLSSPSDKPTDTPTSDTPTTTKTASLQPILASATVSLDGTVMASSSSPLAQSTSVPDTNSNPQSPPSPHTGAIAGGVIGTVAFLALLFSIVIWYRKKRHRHSVTPFILPSTAGTTQIDSATWLKPQSIGDAVRPSSGVPFSPQYSDPYLVEFPGNRYPSFVTDHVSSHLPSDDDVFASTRIARRQGAKGLERIYPYPSRARTSGHYCRSSVENWIEQVVMEEDGSREPSEVLPEYRSAKSLKREKADDDDDDYVLPNSYPPLP
ncbi:hypothetical protein DEU56DRAFT_596073 [Suillus clintonianus]|uniref:uncharacterized protein n=1 Tax=Suillus clintonianus TaxID=1904413 RepID=UPI001B875D68|nr:uncharacterized protein DEU56DRAFT_596073 [Suillus clintonianus]KAG2124455.1 hypothetical protein DEU56DRAFT_596073 [Suillus clintonianus]